MCTFFYMFQSMFGVCVCFFPRLGLSMFEFVINGMHSGRFHTCERNCSRDIFVAFSIQIAFLFSVKFRQVSSVFILVLCFHEISVMLVFFLSGSLLFYLSVDVKSRTTNREPMTSYIVLDLFVTFLVDSFFCCCSSVAVSFVLSLLIDFSVDSDYELVLTSNLVVNAIIIEPI